MDQKFYEKLTKIDIPPPMKNFKNGTFFIISDSNELHDKICSQNFVMTCSNVVYTILCANSKDVFWSKMKAKIGMTKKS
ncbi:hypothetical protein PFMALIP_06256 [Plasmodium falciparum MaliPS096_E11]|uniref:Uncharacterized protein n=1 Tax=Plasmodium falciparum MaliPS096_E11 TaxID=1036727 RepID=A0A024WGK1_PLAFA|nr:hypothetical protein PFMALIP_06256 [Plasmodium falciparum MaliPS096_E11]